MTMPHHMNCNHGGVGWCMACVQAVITERDEARRERDEARALVQELREVVAEHEEEEQAVRAALGCTSSTHDVLEWARSVCADREERGRLMGLYSEQVFAQNEELDAIRAALGCPAGADVLARAEAMRAAFLECLDYAEGCAASTRLDPWFRNEAVNVSRHRALVPLPTSNEETDE